MESVTVHVGAVQDEHSPIHELSEGQSMPFGWRKPDGALALGDDVSVVAGHIRAHDDYWLMTNESRSGTYCVENLEGAGEYVKVQPRRAAVPIPFELSRVLLGVPYRHGNFTVFAPERADSGESEGEPIALLDESSRYFMVLVCLCEPRLRDCGAAAVPTPGEVSRRLAQFSDDRALTRSAVNYHIDYLVEKLRMFAPAGESRTWKREALVAIALKFDLVRQGHLRLLPLPLRGHLAQRHDG